MERIIIDSQIFEIRKNVKSQTSNIFTSELFFEYDNNTNDTNPLLFFLLFETCMDSAFSHWVYESAIYLSYFFELKSKYPELKLLVKQNPKRSYKNLFFKALNINENDIYWLENEEINDCKTVYINIPGNNICINTKPHYLNTVKIKDKNIYKKLIIKFRNIILTNCNIIYPQEKTIENLFFPRSKKENFAPNDRIINYNKIYKLLEGTNYVEYDTINTKDLKEQIKLLVSSQNIFLDWGASFLVNGLFCKDSNVFFYGCIINQLNFEGLKIIYEIHTENNNIKYISYD
jgi:hypothetical protein